MNRFYSRNVIYHVFYLLFLLNVLYLSFFFLLFRPPPRSTLFPYTTLFRSLRRSRRSACRIRRALRRGTRRPCVRGDRKSTRLNSSHRTISYAVFCLKKKKQKEQTSTSVQEYALRTSQYRSLHRSSLILRSV